MPVASPRWSHFETWEQTRFLPGIATPIQENARMKEGGEGKKKKRKISDTYHKPRGGRAPPLTAAASRDGDGACVGSRRSGGLAGLKAQPPCGPRPRAGDPSKSAFFLALYCCCRSQSWVLFWFFALKWGAGPEGALIGGWKIHRGLWRFSKCLFKIYFFNPR
jgi:hypothetical protein